MGGFLSAIGTAYGNFWLWAWGGAVGAELYIVLSAAIVGTVLICLPFYLVLVVLENHRTRRQIGDGITVYSSPSRLVTFLTFLSILWLFFGLLLILGSGILGATEYRANFKECVQMEQDISNTTLSAYVTYCRARDHVNADWSDWGDPHISMSPLMDVNIVTELP